jgi:hypothetical protein
MTYSCEAMTRIRRRAKLLPQPGVWIGAVACVAVLVSFADARAEQIYGNVNRGNVLVRVQCDSGASQETRADAQGNYQVFIAPTGRCTLSLPEQGGASATVYSYDQPARFDFSVVEGSAELQRR